LVRVVVRRLLLTVPLLFIVSALSFVLLSLAAGDAATTILGDQGTAEQYASLRHQLGLDLPLHEQYWHWLRNALSGDFGTSIVSGQSVTQAAAQRLAVSLSLLIGSLVVMLIVGVGLGVFSAVHGGAIGRMVDGLSLLGFALPPFWVGAVLVEVLAVHIRLFPAVGYVSLADSPGEWLRSIALPVIALSLGGVAALAKHTREAMLDVLASEHIRMAWANGIPARSIFLVYAFKNVGTRVLTIMGLLTVSLLGGTLVVETVFALPGLGSLVVTAATQQDLPVVLGVTVFFTTIVVLVNLVTDVAYTWLDPRVRSS
jgi:peptide/nickel transport system permease protein